MKDGATRHFDGIALSYAHSIEALRPVYEQAATFIEPLIAGREVLDVGSGGRFAYDETCAKRVVALDISAPMLDRVQGENVEVVIDDARTMERVPDASVDVVIFSLVLHHINARNVRDTLALLEAMLELAKTKLRPDGTIVILECIFPRPTYYLERMLFAVMRMILNASSRDMIYLFATHHLEAALRKLGLRSFSCHKLAWPRMYDPLAGSFPGKIRIPGALSPMRMVLLIGALREAR